MDADQNGTVNISLRGRETLRHRNAVKGTRSGGARYRPASRRHIGDGVVSSLLAYSLSGYIDRNKIASSNQISNPASRMIYEEQENLFGGRNCFGRFHWRGGPMVAIIFRGGENRSAVEI